MRRPHDRRSGGGLSLRVSTLRRWLLTAMAIGAVWLLVSLSSLSAPGRGLRSALSARATGRAAHVANRAFFKQRASGKLSADQAQVLAMTKRAWSAYREHAERRDFLDVHALAGGSVYAHDMALTLVDSLDTLFVLGLHEEFDDASAWAKVRLQRVMLQRGRVSFFEVTIRSLGGLLSAYYLSAETHFLDLATALADSLTAAFACGRAMPCQKVDLVSTVARGEPSLAEIGTFQLEFAYLAHATKNPAYLAYVESVNRATQSLVETSFTDGLIPVRVNWANGWASRAKISWGAHGDSYYEYLLKQWLQSDKKDDEMRRQYVLAVEGMRSRMLGQSHPSGFTFLGEVDELGQLRPVMEHLACFVPGLLALGYLHGMPKDHLDLAQELTRTCVQMYLFTESKLAPEITRFTTEELFGFTARAEMSAVRNDDYYILRPETVESLMVLHRVTHDPIYREHGRTIMNAIEKHCRTDSGGYRSVHRVVSGPVTNFRPEMESFFIAETLKYLYLLFSDDDVLPLDEIVFNTEAHPFPILK